MQAHQSLLITGPNGFVGQSYLQYLNSLPADKIPGSICLVTRTGHANWLYELKNKTNISVLKCDLENTWKFKFKATHIAHFAADGSEYAYSKDASIKFNRIVGNLMDWTRDLNKPVIFFASSGACYSQNDERKIELIRSRLLAEKNLQNLHEEGIIDLRIGRLFSFIGNFLIKKPHYAVTALVEMALSNSLMEILGNPLTIRSYLDASEMSHWIHRAMEIEPIDQILDIGSSKKLTILDMAEEISKLTGAEIRKAPNSGLPENYFANNAKTLEILGVKQAITWQNSLHTYIDFARNWRLDAQNRIK
jgi:nucleoside-diphosphate-sugar epimerase